MPPEDSAPEDPVPEDSAPGDGESRVEETPVDELDASVDAPAAEVVLAEIASDAPLELPRLRALAGPSDTIVAGFVELWPRVPAERRREALALLQQLSEEDPTLDFHRIHLTAFRDADPATRILAIRGIVEEETVEYMRLLAAQLRDDGEPSVRAELADALGVWVLSMEFELIDEDDGDLLTSALREAVEDVNEEEEVRGRALEALGASSEEEVKELIGESYELGSHRMRVAALRAMGRNASDDWLPVLLFNFDDDDAEIRAIAAVAAGQLLMEDAVPPLTQLIDDTDEDVQIAAIAAIGEIGDDECERILNRLVEESSEPHIRDAASDALAQLQVLTMDVEQGRGTLEFDEQSTVEDDDGE